jgi:A/G-specific adenine glycosylase
MDSFARRLLAWYDRHGRKALPWKRGRDAYRTWVSEIMLQQTQVATVIPYFERFMRRFPDIRALARAPLDVVLAHWAGLGYYARARNLHACARRVVAQHDGSFPRDLASVADLPGIGRSTAAAILAFACGQRHAILDGNVKRVLARFHTVETPIGTRSAEPQFWALAESHTPSQRVAAYTQAIMDLGAMVCRRVRPACEVCPVAGDCRAFRTGRQHALPLRAGARPRAVRETVMVMLRDRRGRVLLEKRPPHGIWGGLWSLPEISAVRDLRVSLRKRFGCDAAPAKPWPAVHHDFTHFRLVITPQPAFAEALPARAMEDNGFLWYKPGVKRIGLPAPVQRLIERLQDGKNCEVRETRPRSRRPRRARVSRRTGQEDLR